MKKIIGTLMLVVGIILMRNNAFADEGIEKRCSSACATEDQSNYNSCMQICRTEEEQIVQKCIQGGSTEKDCRCIRNGGIKLNTSFPFIGRCIEKSSDGKVITSIAGVFTNILMTLIITIGFGMIIRGGVQFAMNEPAKGRKTITNVIIAFAALGSLGIVLRLINPNFFK